MNRSLQNFKSKLGFHCSNRKLGRRVDNVSLSPQSLEALSRNSRRFSSSTAYSPYLMLGSRVNEVSEDASGIGDVHLFDPAKEALLTVSNRTIPEEIITSKLIGSSHGLGLFRDEFDHHLLLSDLYNPWASRSTTIPLPPVSYTDTEVAWNVAVSFSSPSEEQEDSVVAIKFLGRQVSFIRPFGDIRWTNIVTPFDCSENSSLMYSKRDKGFYLPAPGCNYLCSWDLHFKKDSDNDPKFHKLMFRNLPEWEEAELKLLESCCKKETLVESSGGERFLVKWYSQGFFYSDHKEFRYMTRRFLVFREEETTEEGRNMCYTEDIGDLCIFISKSHPFCVPASSCPGLKPNSIYFVGGSLGVYDLTTKTIHQFKPPQGPLKDPYWLPPSSA